MQIRLVVFFVIGALTTSALKVFAYSPQFCCTLVETSRQPSSKSAFAASLNQLAFRDTREFINLTQHVKKIQISLVLALLDSVMNTM